LSLCTVNVFENEHETITSAQTSQKVQLLGPDFRNGMVRRIKLRQSAKFCGDRPNRRRDMATFQDGGRHHVRFFDI